MFIKIFWRQRDPDPDTEENEYREQFYERLAYANEHFSSGMPGWKTDRGRIYIKFGKPDEIEAHPSGGPYQQKSYEGSGTITTYPFETWFYRYIPNVGSGIEIEFVDPSGSGEYRIARDANEKKALAHVPGPDQASVDSPNGYLRERDSPFGRIEQLRNLEEAPPVARRNPNDGVTGTPKPTTIRWTSPSVPISSSSLIIACWPCLRFRPRTAILFSRTVAVCRRPV